MACIVAGRAQNRKGVKGENIQQGQWRSQAFYLVQSWERSCLDVLEDVIQRLQDSAWNRTAEQDVGKPGF